MVAIEPKDATVIPAPPPVADIILSIILSCYNTRGLLENCLQSIADNPASERYEVIVVDDASSDGTADMVRNRFPDVRLLRNPVNLHYTRSNNRGLDASRGEFLLLLNCDTIVLPNALDQMVEFLRSHPDAGVVGCRLLNADGSVQWSVKSLPNAESAIFGARSVMVRLFPGNRFSRKHLLTLDRDITQPMAIESGYVSGAAAMSPRAVVTAVGTLDEQFVYHVDADHCKRICDAGYRCYYLPSATIIHLNHRGGTLASLPTRFRSLMMFELHSYRYYRKHVRGPARTPMQAVVAFGLSCHFLLLAVGQMVDYLSEARRFHAQVRGGASVNGR